MELQQAVGILNAFRHRGRTDWGVLVTRFGAVASSDNDLDVALELSPFEAIAVAEKYQREIGTADA